MTQDNSIVLYTVTNIDNIKKQFTTHTSFIDYVKRIAAENEDRFLIIDETDAINYINDFCPELHLTN